MSYKVFRNSLGKVSAVIRTDDTGEEVAIPFRDETNSLTIELRQWEATNEALDLSDHPVSYKVFRNDKGKVDAINRNDGATVPTWDKKDPLTIGLREWEAVNGALDVSDRTPVVKEKEPDYIGFYNAMMLSPLGLFTTVRLKAKSSPALIPAYVDLGMAVQFKQFSGFQSSITNLFTDMAEARQPFTLVQKQEIRRLLDANGFKAIVLPLVLGDPGFLG